MNIHDPDASKMVNFDLDHIVPQQQKWRGRGGGGVQNDYDF